MDGKYRIVSVIGEGGMSAVYEALHLGISRPVALKVLHPALGDDAVAVRRLEHEAKMVSTIGHPNICGIHDLGCTEDGCSYLVMERLLGETLGSRLAALGTMSFGEMAPIVRAVLAALQAAHDKGVVHRDLKPENIFLEQWRAGGRMTCKLLDFGIATFVGPEPLLEAQRLTQSGWVMGTPYYMAPEQARGDCSLDHRVDLWAVGVILYEALTGRRPFVATNYNALLVKILTSQPRPIARLNPAVHPLVAVLVDRAMAKLREDRFQTAREFARAVADAERLCASEDPHAPTLVMRRNRPRGARRDAQRRPAHPWQEMIEDPSTVVDDESTSVDRHLHRIATGQPATAASHSAVRREPQDVFGASPPVVRTAGSSRDSDSVTRPRVAGAPRPRPKAPAAVPPTTSPERSASRAEDTATTLVVPRKPQR